MKNTCMSSDYIPRFFLNSLQRTLRTLPILNSCMKDRCGFLFVRYKRHCCTELVSWEHAACPLSGIKKRLLVGGWLNTSSVVISIGATPSVLYREVVRSWEGGSTVLVTALVGRDKSAILSNYASQEWHNMVAEVFIIYMLLFHSQSNVVQQFLCFPLEI